MAAELAAELAADAGEPRPAVARPAGAPTLAPLSAVSRRRRADYFAILARFPIGSDGELELDEGNELVQMSVAAALYADVEDLLALVAAPMPGGSEAFRRWVASATDEQLMQLFAWYQANNQPGEAQPSRT